MNGFNWRERPVRNLRGRQYPKRRAQVGFVEHKLSPVVDKEGVSQAAASIVEKTTERP